MPSLDRVTPVILTHNEEPNIGRTLDRLSWAERVLVVDSGSRDKTRDIVTAAPNTRIITRPFDSHVRQWNFAVANVDTEWVLTLDADYQVPPELVSEIATIPDSTPLSGFFVSFEYRVLDTVIKRHLYPPKLVLFKPARARFIEDIDTERVTLEGSSGTLRTPVVHDDRKPLGRWLHRQRKYACIAARQITSTSWKELSFPDRVRRTRVLAPLLVIPYCLICRGLIREGWAGWYYTMERALVETLKSMALLTSYREG